MNQNTSSESTMRHWLRGWLILAVVIYVIGFIAYLLGLIPGAPKSLAEELFLLLTGSVMGTTVIVALWAGARWFLRNPKHGFFLAACLATLVALFYAEEDWRGWHQWRQFKAAWEAKGEHFDLASSAPPPVPAEQNFAMTPLVYTSYGSILTRDGKPIPPAKRDNQFVIRMHMPVSQNDESVTGAAGDRIRGTFTQLAAYQKYYRELSAKTNLFQVPPEPRSPAQDVLLALSKYDSNLDELRAAVKLPESRFPLDYDNESPWAILLPHLAQIKSCAVLLQLRSNAELQNNQPDKAMADVRLTLQLADKVRTEPILISHLVRISMAQMALQSIWEGLQQHKWTDAQLVAIEQELGEQDFVAAYRLGMHGELGGQTGEMDLIRRHPDRLQDITGLWDFDSGMRHYSVPGAVAHIMPSGWFYQNEYRSVRLVMDYYLPAANVEGHTFSPALAHQGDETLLAETKTAGLFNWYERLMVSALGNATKRFAFGQASVDEGRVAIALERYRLAHGEFPQSLDALAPQFIEKLPHDVVGGQPLKYRRAGNDRFLLYSVGWNETDEGGEVVFRAGQSPSVDLNKGDWIWCAP